MDRHPAGWLRWAPLCRLQSGHSSPWLPGARSPQPTVPCLLRPFWKGSPPGQVPWGSPQVPWLRNTALVAAVARKAETTKYGPWVTQAENRTRAAPGPRGADGVTTTRKQQEHSWESYDALAANWTMRRQREPHQWGLGTSQLGLEGPQWWHRGYASTWLHEVTMITATTQKIKWETHTLPWLLNAKSACRFERGSWWNHAQGLLPDAAGNRMKKLWRWGRRGWELVVPCWRCYVSVYGCPSQRTLSECASTHMHIKEIWIMEIHSYHSRSNVYESV